MSMKQSSLTEFASTSDRVVYITGVVSRQADVYHSDPDCQYLTDRHGPVSLSEARDRALDECSLCAGEVEYNSGPKAGPQSNRSRCKAATREENQCDNPEVPGLGVCQVHLDRLEDEDSGSGNKHTPCNSGNRPVWERARDELLSGGRDD